MQEVAYADGFDGQCQQRYRQNQCADTEGAQAEQQAPADRHGAHKPHGALQAEVGRGNWGVMMPTSFVRKKVIDKVGFFNENMPPAGEDMEYWTRCSFETKFYYLDEPLVLYRIHHGNISSDSIKYLDLPLYLKKVAENALLTRKIDKKSFNLLINSICQFQIRTVKGNFIKTIKNLFRLNHFWVLGKNNCKMILYVLFLKKE